jgi:hypothetical protein
LSLQAFQGWFALSLGKGQVTFPGDGLKNADLGTLVVQLIGALLPL